MKCEEVSKELVTYIDGRTGTGTRRIEEHLAVCEACRTRAEEFRKISMVLDEVPAIEPSFGFDARLRQRIAAQPRRPRFVWFVRQPRLALSMALLAALTIMVAKLPLGNPVARPGSAAVQQEDFNAIRNLGVLENYDVVTKLGALSDLTAMPVNDAQPPLRQPNQQPSSDGGNGGA
ncbi:MAG: zf-HC2 domain-containing protein [Acidobacteriota bacterium]|nr:zf-HC2 domain-containing protein [Acidobacteriota bacterium]